MPKPLYSTTVLYDRYHFHTAYQRKPQGYNFSYFLVARDKSNPKSWKFITGFVNKFKPNCLTKQDRCP